MAHLYPIPFADLALRMCREVEQSQSIFDLPVRKWWTPDPALDLSAAATTPFASRSGSWSILSAGSLIRNAQ